MNNPLLSICIPTYNRAPFLDETIKSIVTQKRFYNTNDVEIVISDNSSTDNTKEIAEKYRIKYGNKIRYYCNSENIKDANFEKALSLGKGLFLKLNNDTLNHVENSLDLIIDSIQINIQTKDILFFANGTTQGNKETLLYKDLNSFVKNVSFWSTWIACFGIWRDDFNSLHDFSRNAKLQLVQTDVLFRLISAKKKVYVNNMKIFMVKTPRNKGGYNFFEVFVTNYLGILREYVCSKQIYRLTYFNEKTKLLLYHIIPTSLSVLKTSDKYSFSFERSLPILLNKYRYHPIFYFGLLYFLIRAFFYFILTHKRNFNEDNNKNIP